MTDEIAKSIDAMYRALTGAPAAVADRLERPAIAGNNGRPPSMRPIENTKRGRKAALTKAEAIAIKADLRSYDEICAAYGISKDTIMKVKQTGRYKGIPYIPRDVDPEEFGYLPKMSDYPVPTNVKRGRPLATGRDPLTDAELSEMLADLGDAHDVAYRFNVTVQYVRRLRKKNKIVTGASAIMLEDTKIRIAVDDRPVWIIAREYKVPKFIIERIKQEYTLGGNDEGGGNGEDSG